MILALMFKSLTSNRVMMFAGYITMMIVLLLFLCVSDPSVELSTFLAVIVGMGDAMAQSGLFAFAATTDSLYTSAVMAFTTPQRTRFTNPVVSTLRYVYSSFCVQFVHCILSPAKHLFLRFTILAIVND